MHKVTALLASLGPDERERLLDYLRSPYWVTHAGLVDLYRAFLPFLEGRRTDPPTDQELFAAFFNESSLDKKRLSYPLHYLNVEVERFLGMEYYRRQGHQKDLNELKALMEKGQDKHLRHRWSQLQKERSGNLKARAAHWEEEMELQQLAALEAFQKQDMEAYQKCQQKASTYLDQAYFLRRLKMSCERLNDQRIFSTAFHHPFSKQVVRFLEQQEHRDPLTAMYLHIYYTLEEMEEESHFAALCALIDEHQQRISPTDMREIYLYALNHCIRKFRSGQTSIASKALHLYQQGIETRILFDGDYLPSRTFTNAVKQAIVLRQFDWIKSFIESYRDHLAPESRQDTLFYNLADYYYHLEEYEKVLDQLKQLRFSDLHYHLGSRVLMLKTYYHMEETDALLSLLASFSVYLRRKKELSTSLRKTYLNFCTLLHKVLSMKPSADREKIREQIRETNPLAERSWLLAIAAG
jgi:hypothetical protein